MFDYSYWSVDPRDDHYADQEQVRGYTDCMTDFVLYLQFSSYDLDWFTC